MGTGTAGLAQTHTWLGWCIQNSLEVMARDSPSQKLTASGNFPARRQTCQRSVSDSETSSRDMQHYSTQAPDAPLFLFSLLKEPKLIRTGELFDDRSTASSLRPLTNDFIIILTLKTNNKLPIYTAVNAKYSISKYLVVSMSCDPMTPCFSHIS